MRSHAGMDVRFPGRPGNDVVGLGTVGLGEVGLGVARYGEVMGVREIYFLIFCIRYSIST